MSDKTPSPDLSIAFVCVQNAGRSQMATAFAEREKDIRGVDPEIITGGTQPASRVHPVVVEKMKELDFDLSTKEPREITFQDIEKADYVITMGCSDKGVCPATWSGESREWDLEDPEGATMEKVGEIRDDIKGRIEKLFDELFPTTAA